LYKSVLCFEHIVKYSLVDYEVSKDYWQLVTVLCNEGDHWILCAGYDQTCNCWVCLGLAQTDSTFCLVTLHVLVRVPIASGSMMETQDID
jgi:hypothetical protein